MTLLCDALAPEKRCSACGLTQPLDHFGSNGRGGLSTQCRSCKRAGWRSYVSRHPEMRSAATRPERPTDPSEIARAWQQWRREGRPGAGVGACCDRCGVPAGVGVPLKAIDGLGAARPDLEAIGIAFTLSGRRVYRCMCCCGREGQA